MTSKRKAKRDLRRQKCPVSGVEISPERRRADRPDERQTPNLSTRQAEDAACEHVAKRRCAKAGLRSTIEAQRDMAKRDYEAPHWHAQITGQLGPNGEEMADAGDKYARDRDAYLRAISAPPETPRDGQVGPTKGETPQETIERATRAFLAADGALESAGGLPKTETHAVVCRTRDFDVFPVKINPLRAGLEALAAHYRGTGEIS